MAPDPPPPRDPSSPPAPPADGPPPYRRYRARPRLPGRAPTSLEAPRSGPPRAGHPATPGQALPDGAPRRRRLRASPWRALRWLVLALAGWVALSVVLFLVSGQLRQDRVDGATKAALSAPGLPVISPTTVLVLGSDQRTKSTREPGAASSGPSRSDSIQLLRIGGGHSQKLSIPRDTIVPIPGHGEDKVNAAFAFGGAALTVRTLREYLGIDIDHVILVDFERFPRLIDAMGGVTYSGGCVVSKINGGFRNGGYTLRLRAGSSHIDGKQALALSRTRKNLCNRRENDLTRARRQQKLVAAMRSRVLSPGGFLHWPWVAWRAPQAVRTDMGALGLSSLAATIATSGNAPARVLRPTGVRTLADGGAGLVVSDGARRASVERFLR